MLRWVPLYVLQYPLVAVEFTSATVRLGSSGLLAGAGSTLEAVIAVPATSCPRQRVQPFAKEETSG
jgi:hypothetical protein